MRNTFRLLSLLLLAFVSAQTPAATAPADSSATKQTCDNTPTTYHYRVTFKNKENNTYTLKRPYEFLSQKALDRRLKYGIKVDEHDLPVTPVYLSYLSSRGLRVISSSKWNNTAVVETSDTALVNSLLAVTFVESVRRVGEKHNNTATDDSYDRKKEVVDSCDELSNYYGHAETQVKMIGVDKLHHAGYTGKDITIAVIDGGFLNTDCIAGLDSVRILGTHNFVDPSVSVYEGHPHGTMVLSCIAANRPNSLVGTAPDASFYLLVSEYGPTEYMVEEDFWCAALEYADSAGVDIVTSSLGYYAFDDSINTHKYYELDGETAVNSHAASMAASRGLLLLNSAGNSGDEEWKKIGFPGDAKNILTVGAVTENGTNTVFSSVGNTADGRIKPDVMAMGEYTWLFDMTGRVSEANGTSFSTPLMAGGVACLLEAFPDKTPEEIISAVQRAGNNAAHPDNIYGYGIPDLWKAYNLLQTAK